MSAPARIRPAASTLTGVGHSGVSTGIGSNPGKPDNLGRAGATGREGGTPSLLPDGIRMIAEETSAQASTVGDSGNALTRLMAASDATLGRISDLIGELEKEAQRAAALARVTARKIAEFKQRDALRGVR
jgi:hypothetical protein